MPGRYAVPIAAAGSGSRVTAFDTKNRVTPTSEPRFTRYKWHGCPTRVLADENEDDVHPAKGVTIGTKLAFKESKKKAKNEDG